MVNALEAQRTIANSPESLRPFIAGLYGATIIAEGVSALAGEHQDISEEPFANPDAELLFGYSITPIGPKGEIARAVEDGKRVDMTPKEIQELPVLGAVGATQVDKAGRPNAAVTSDANMDAIHASLLWKKIESYVVVRADGTEGILIVENPHPGMSMDEKINNERRTIQMLTRYADNYSIVGIKGIVSLN